MEFVLITEKNWQTAIQLKPLSHQSHLLPENVVMHSMARAFVTREKRDCYLPYLILHEGKPIGAFLFRNYGHGCNIISFFIDGRYQGKGYGRRAMLHFHAWVKNNFPRASEVELCVADENTVARRLYENLGYEYTGETSELGNLYMELHF